MIVIETTIDKMPTGCDKCMFCANVKDTELRVCDIMEYIENDIAWYTETERPSWCPLREVEA